MTSTPTLPRLRQLLDAFDFQRLFVEELSWDNLQQYPLAYSIQGTELNLTPIAQKRGVQVWRCAPAADGRIPNAATRIRLSSELTKDVAEHLLVFVDAAQRDQVWLWVRREHGVSRPRHFTNREDIASRLRGLFIALEEEAGLGVVGVTSKVKKAFDVETVTKKFYDVFKKKHDEFVNSIAGINEQSDREWYGSLMLNRLMFLYFIQRKGFLAGDEHYLNNRLKQLQTNYPADANSFYAFYRQFLLRLFHEGLNQRQRSPELTALIGDVPYLNGGLFDLHELEQNNPAIAIPDHAFSTLFDFFDQYQWQLDDREGKVANEINPDVLGYIFEKYINQKQMGAYYTKEDITEYISKNTIIPFMFDHAARTYPAGFAPNSPIWQLLSANPQRYIYPAVLKGVELPLPPEIEAGIANIAARDGWNRPAAEAYALPTETWREHVARRQRCQAIQAQLQAGDVTTINELITLNLNIRQFAADVIGYVADPASLQALFAAIRAVTVLDPTCGSGAFLFAALNILEPLYAGCLERIQGLVDDQTSLVPADLHEVLAESNNRQHHPNQRYFVLKQIMLKNLYGVDIMDEAVEICKLRLFLKLVAHVDRDPKKPNQGLEPLPDIDFNIRAGNTLVGFASEAEVLDLLQQKFDVFNMSAKIHASAQQTSTAYRSFREQQSRYDVDGSALANEKAALRKHLADLNQQLDQYLAQEYGVQPAHSAAFERWRATHKPFHWFVEFYEIIEGHGGFDVIIGNPPYIEYSKVKKDYTIRGYQTESCGNLYAFTMERSINLLSKHGFKGLIIPISAFGTNRMRSLQEVTITKSENVWQSSYGIRPSKLFDGAEQRLTILLMKKKYSKKDCEIFSTKYYRWNHEERDFLLQNLIYQNITEFSSELGYTKISTEIEKSILKKMPKSRLGVNLSENGDNKIYWHRIPGYFIKSLDFIPYFYSDRDGEKKSEDYKVINILNEDHKDFILLLINSTLFYWFWFSISDGYHCGKHELLEFRFDSNLIDINNKEYIKSLSYKLMEDIKINSYRRVRKQKFTNVIYDEFYLSKSKPIIDEIDRLLAQHYGFSDEELDYIINYDIKYRMGKDAGDEE
ncbi:Eco57I restriction-modification methylase domain-containing protein [Herpetosiphon sp. NSE202]|uniref:Eco57I restriction-modification methylase domain-containing protein n=1 Tax=Herpetosiphon sp. NSE202 TaxID=3351349 RepID=UPI0036283E3E